MNGRDIEILQERLMAAEEKRDEVIKNALHFLSHGCKTHQDVTYEEFIAAGGNKCLMCLRQTLKDLEAENHQLLHRVQQLAERDS